MADDKPRLSTRDASATICALGALVLLGVGGGLVAPWLGLILPGGVLLILALALGTG